MADNLDQRGNKLVLISGEGAAGVTQDDFRKVKRLASPQEGTRNG